ncbi:MAG TPA: GMC family oxidoreductase N-terminal domain-containing protein, partial [Thermoanaerobaculia bacterium]|nr:GMC family oxidoreductase N-terminal domain-containing protein [Thermoanaerobaculia bacterium]
MNPQTGARTPEERRLAVLLRVLGFLFTLAILAYLLPALVGPWKPFFIQLPFVTNSVVKIGVLAALAFVASGDTRRYRALVLIVILGHAISELATIAVLLWGETSGTVGQVPARTLLWGSIALDGAILVLLVWFYRSAERARFALRYLSPGQFRTLASMVEVVITGRPVADPPSVARIVDRYLADFRARSRWIMKAVLIGLEWYPVLTFHPPLSVLSPGDRRAFLYRRFYEDVTRRLVPPFWRTIVQGMIRMGKQLCYLGYYSDPRTHAITGYVPFSERPTTLGKLKQHPSPRRKPLEVETASDVTAEVVTGDVVIVGSGAGAAILAEGLAARGRDVLMIERGDHWDPSTFTEDEVEMLARLYDQGALQLTRDFRFQVLQGSCVGGTTVVNNAVCFDIPAHVLARWNDPAECDAAIDEPRLRKSFQDVRTRLEIVPQNHGNLNPGARYFLAGIHAVGLDLPPNGSGVVDANIRDCLGCGYCNIGCAYGRKLSMLDVVLPETQEKYNVGGRKALRIIAGCEAEKLHARGDEITRLTCSFRDGRRLDVRGNTFVVAAGAISSSLLLRNSGIASDRAGKRLAFNMGSPITAVFRDVVDSYDGLQISHYLRLSPDRGFVVETWFNPPVAQALTMPGWFEDHERNMRRYNRMTCAGILVGTEGNAEARRGGLTGREVDYDPTAADLGKLLDGLMLVGNAFLAAGAECVIPNTFDYYEFCTPGELRRLPELVKDASDITLGTGHPQGGNPMSVDPKKGVVDPEFRVHGYRNLHVVDASVFPTSIGVNPQLTVMALADYAASCVK